MKTKVVGTRTIVTAIDEKTKEETKELIGIEETCEFPADMAEMLKKLGEKDCYDKLFSVLYDEKKNEMLDKVEAHVQKQAGIVPSKKRAQARFVKVPN